MIVARDFEYLRDLVVETVKAELNARHFKRVLGPAWWLLDPLLMAFLYFFITTVMFHYGGGRSFLLYIMIATVSWRWFSRSIDNAPLLIGSYQGVLKQTNFPPIAVLLIFAATELVFFVMGLGVVMVIVTCAGHLPGPSVALLPLIVLVQLLLTVGLMTYLALAGVFLRDVSQITYLVTGVWFYLSPGIYPVDSIPPSLRWIFALNPFSTLFPAYESVLLKGEVPPLVPLLVWLVAGAALCAFSIRQFEKNRLKFYKLL